MVCQASQVKKWIMEGAIGKVESAKFTYCMKFINYSSRVGDPKRAGGALLDISICTITYAYRLFGYPVKIESKGLVQSGIDHEEEIYMEFPAGEKVSIRASIVDFKGLEKMKIQGSERQIKVFLYHAGQKVVCRKGLFKKEQYKGKGATIGYMPEFDTVASEIREGLKESQVVPLQATSDLMHILDTIRAQIGLEYTNLE